MPSADQKPEDAPQKSFGNMSEQHWSRARKGQNREAIEFYQERSRAPGVADGGSHRNHYCPSCRGVVPLAYDSRQPVDRQRQERCPHCGTEFVPGVREMFNWVEMDQVPASDARALLPWLALVGLVALALVLILLRACAA
jgi:hypothetical protein